MLHQGSQSYLIHKTDGKLKYQKASHCDNEFEFNRDVTKLPENTILTLEEQQQIPSTLIQLL